MINFCLLIAPVLNTLQGKDFILSTKCTRIALTKLSTAHTYSNKFQDLSNDFCFEKGSNTQETSSPKILVKRVRIGPFFTEIIGNLIFPIKFVHIHD